MGALGGCSSPPALEVSDAPEVPYVEAAELTALLATEDPVLLEFCVPVGCDRCGRMRPRVNELAESLDRDVITKRVNLNDHRGFASSLAIRVCPTYVLLRNGKELRRFEHPTATDLIASEITTTLASP